MKPGRELDAIVAEKVFGDTWMQQHLDRVKQYDHEIEIAKQKNIATAALLNRGWEQCMAEIKWKYYSADIAAVWQVVEYMRQTLQFSLGIDDENGDGWWCIFESGSRHYEGYGQTAPHAICLAALKAVEESHD